MTSYERELIDVIRGSNNEAKAILTAIEVILLVLKLLEASE